MDMEQKAAQQQVPPQQAPEKFCKHCGGKIPADAVVCTLCGRQVEQVAQGGAPNIVINNANQNTNSNVNAYVAAKARNKWVALCLCLFGRFRGAQILRRQSGAGRALSSDLRTAGHWSGDRFYHNPVQAKSLFRLIIICNKNIGSPWSCLFHQAAPIFLQTQAPRQAEHCLHILFRETVQ